MCCEINFELVAESRGGNEPTKQDPWKQQEQKSLHCVKIYVTAEI